MAGIRGSVLQVALVKQHVRQAILVQVARAEAHMELPLGQITLDASSLHLLKFGERDAGCLDVLLRMLGFVGLPTDLMTTKGRYIEVVVLLPVLDGCIPHHLQAPAQKVCNLLGSAVVATVARGQTLQAAAESRVEGSVVMTAPGVLAVVSPSRPGICILPLSRLVRLALPGSPTAGTPTIGMTPAVPAGIGLPTVPAGIGMPTVPSGIGMPTLPSAGHIAGSVCRRGCFCSA